MLSSIAKPEEKIWPIKETNAKTITITCNKRKPTPICLYNFLLELLCSCKKKLMTRKPTPICLYNFLLELVTKIND